MKPILTLTHNGLEMTKKAVDSFLHQDTTISIFVIDNGSTDGTLTWLEMIGILLDGAEDNVGVSAGWNAGLKWLFEKCNASHVLVANNDVELPPWFYSELLSYDVPFVTGYSVDDKAKAYKFPPERFPLIGHPDFSAFLIRRDAWQAIGPFDEDMKFYAQDCDYHVRAHRLGIPLKGASVPFYHERSSTLRLASPEERAAINQQANADRHVFRTKYGCIPGESSYEELFR
jgi:GT2 family glycosyltransferase